MRNENVDVIEAKETTRVNPIAVASLIAYIFLLVIIGYLILILPLPVLFLALLYPVVGIAYSHGLLQRKTWSWYVAMIMWISEGIVSSWAAYMNSWALSTYPQSVIAFVLIAFFRFASAAYLAKRKIRESFHAAHATHITECGYTIINRQGYQMPKCPKCGGEIEEEDGFCKRCGTKLIGHPQDQTRAGSSLEDEVKNAVVKRLEGIKNRDESAVRALIDESYSKFDDWPPFRRQKTAEALENEFGAFKVLSNYSYELKDFEANVLGNIAVATFTIHYQGAMRNRPFEVTSCVTSVLRKQDSGWKVVHEHYSRFSEETQQQFIPPRRTIQP